MQSMGVDADVGVKDVTIAYLCIPLAMESNKLDIAEWDAKRGQRSRLEHGAAASRTPNDSSNSCHATTACGNGKRSDELLGV